MIPCILVLASFILPHNELNRSKKLKLGNESLDVERTGLKIKAVTFDLWETLIFEREGCSSLRNKLRCKHLAQSFTNLGIRVTIKQVELAFKELTSYLVKVWETNNDVSHIDQLRFIYKFISKGSSTLEEEWVKELDSAFIFPMFEVPVYINPDVYSLLNILKKHNRKVGLISNTGITPGVALREFLIKERVSDYFDDMIYSEEVGIRKPNPRIFHLAAEHLGIKPEEIVHVGDNLRTDVWGAKYANLKTIYLSSVEGRDSIAESDPTSIIALSRKMDDITREQAKADIEIKRLSEVIEAIKQIENS